MKILIPDLERKVLDTLEPAFGVNQASLITEVLLWCELSGIKPMGIAKLTGTEPIQNIKPIHEIKIERDTKLSRLINAGGHPAPLVSLQATDTAIEKAKSNGLGLIGVHNTYSSNLAQGFYAERIAKQDLIGIVMARSPASTAPFDSIEPVFGTNPIGFSFPTAEAPLVFDMTTAAMTWSGLILAKAHGQSLPANIAIDKDGNLTTDPKKAMEGATLPFDNSYKGSGLGLMVETLAGPLVNSLYCDPALDHEYGSLFMAIDPNLLVDVAIFKKHCSDLLKKIKNSRKKKGAQEIRLPGERSRKIYLDNLKLGFVRIDDTVAKELGWYT